MTKKSTTKFTVSFTGSTVLDVEAIWPDGDAPENPTVEDAIEQALKCNDILEFIDIWGLLCSLRIRINDQDVGL